MAEDGISGSSRTIKSITIDLKAAARGFGEKEAIYQKEPKNLDFHW
jgi:hypothetical protein